MLSPGPPLGERDPKKNHQARLTAILIRYTLSGVLLGFFFALIRNLIIHISDEYSISLAGVIGAYRSQPILWLVDAAPLNLGL